MSDYETTLYNINQNNCTEKYFPSNSISIKPKDNILITKETPNSKTSFRIDDILLTDSKQSKDLKIPKSEKKHPIYDFSSFMKPYSQTVSPDNSTSSLRSSPVIKPELLPLFYQSG